MSLRLGSPPQAFQVFMDTGSDLVWVPCLDSPESAVFDCIDSDEYHQSIDIFYPRHSRSRKPESCDGTFCLDIHTSADPYDTCIMTGCPLKDLVEGSCSMSCPPFSYRYGDGIVKAELMRERIVLNGPSIAKLNSGTFVLVVQMQLWMGHLFLNVLVISLKIVTLYSNYSVTGYRTHQAGGYSATQINI